MKSTGKPMGFRGRLPMRGRSSPKPMMRGRPAPQPMMRQNPQRAQAQMLRRR